MLLNPGKKLVGRAVTVQFMPVRADVESVVQADAKARGLARLNNQTIIDMLGPGDVIVVDLFGKVDGGTFVGDNLAYYICKKAKTGGSQIAESNLSPIDFKEAIMVKEEV